MITVHVKVKGSGKSGNFGHAGRPGQVGGSAESGITIAKYTKFEDMPAYQKYGNNSNPDPASRQDEYLKAIIQDQGFDGNPDITDEE